MRYRFALLTLALTAALPLLAARNSPLKSSSVAIHITATVNERLSLVSASPSISFSLRPRRVAEADRPLIITTSWNLDANRTGVVVTAFFSDPVHALSPRGGAAAQEAIPGSRILARAPAGEFASFARTASPQPGEGALEIFRQRLTPRVNDLDSRTDIIEFQVDLRGRSQLAAGDYEGDLTLVAQAY